MLRTSLQYLLVVYSSPCYGGRLFMKILLQTPTAIPPDKYGGTNRVVWSLGKELVKQGHDVTFLAPAGSTCAFAPIVYFTTDVPLQQQIPDG